MYNVGLFSIGTLLLVSMIFISSQSEAFAINESSKFGKLNHMPGDAVFDSNNAKMYVKSDHNKISIYEPSRYCWCGEIEFDKTIYEMTVDPIDGTLYVSQENSILIIKEEKIIDSFKVSGNVKDMHINEVTGELLFIIDKKQGDHAYTGLYAAAYNSNGIKIKNYLNSDYLKSITVNTNKNEIYVTEYEHKGVYILDGYTGKKTNNNFIRLMGSPTFIDFSPHTNLIYVGHTSGSHKISIIDGDTKKWKTVTTYGPIRDMALNYNTGILYVINPGYLVEIDNKLKVKETVFESIEGFRNNVKVDSNTNTVYLFTQTSFYVLNGSGENLAPKQTFKAEATSSFSSGITKKDSSNQVDSQQIDSLISENKELRRELKGLEDTLDAYRNEIADWKAKYNRIFSEKQTLEQSYNNALSDNAEWSDAYKKLHDDASKLANNYNIQKKNVDTLKNNQKALTNALTTQKNNYEDRLSAADRSKIEQLASTNPILKGFLHGKINYYIEPVPSYAHPDVSTKSIPHFVKNMERLNSDLIKYNRVYDERYADIIIDWKKDIGSHLGKSIFKAYNEVGLGGSTCYGQWQPFDSHTVSRIMWHEVGHAMGYKHSSNQNNIMYPTMPQQFDLDYVKSFSLDEGGVYQIPLCGGSFGYSVSTNEKNQGFSSYVLTPGTNAYDFLTKREGKHYSECMLTNLVSGAASCTVPTGSTLIIYNKDDLLKFNTMNIDLKIDQKYQYPSSLNWKWDRSGFSYDINWLNDVISKYRN